MNKPGSLKTINEIRRANYLALFAKFKEECLSKGLPLRGTLNRFAEMLEMNPRYLSQIGNGVKNIGDAVSLKLEVKHGLPKGWMDSDHSKGIDPAGPQESEFVAMALKLYRESPLEVQAHMMRFMLDRERPKK